LRKYCDADETDIDVESLSVNFSESLVRVETVVILSRSEFEPTRCKGSIEVECRSEENFVFFACFRVSDLVALLFCFDVLTGPLVGGVDCCVREESESAMGLIEEARRTPKP
jgi:hypothetical protein